MEDAAYSIVGTTIAMAFIVPYINGTFDRWTLRLYRQIKTRRKRNMRQQYEHTAQEHTYKEVSESTKSTR